MENFKAVIESSFVQPEKQQQQQIQVTTKEKICNTYSEESCAQANSCAEPKLLFRKAMAV